MNGKKAKAQRRAERYERLRSPPSPQGDRLYLFMDDINPPTDEQILAAIGDMMNRNGSCVLYMDRDHLDLPLSAAVIRVMNRIVDECLWASEQIATVQVSEDMAMRTERAFSTRKAPPWASMADRFCPEARIFVVIQGRGFPEQFTALAKGWRDPYTTPSQTKQEIDHE